MWNDSVSIVIPAFNEAENIGPVVKASLHALEEMTPDYEVVVVNDGSVDGTAGVIDELARAHPCVRAVHHDENLGVGLALRTLFSEASKDWVLLIPGDGQIKPNELPNFLGAAGASDLVVGHRRHRADPLQRRINARLFNLAVSAVARKWVNDVDSSTLYRRAIFNQITLQSSSAFVHAEVYVRAVRAGFRATEIEIGHYPRLAGQQTGANWTVVVSAMSDLFQLWGELG